MNKIEIVSHQVIYDFIKFDAANDRTLHTNLRHKRKTKKPHGYIDKRGQIKNRVSIAARPDESNKKVRIGDLEGDTIIGKDHKSLFRSPL